MPPSNSTSSSPPGAEPGVATLDGDAAPRAEHDDGAGTHDAGVGDGGGGADSDGADDGDGFADAVDEAGRVASRPGYPAEPAARSRPFGRVSLAPPFASLTARSACPAARCAPRRCRYAAVAARVDRIARRTAAVSSPVSPLVRALLRSASRTSLRTAPFLGARTDAGTATSASGSVLRTTACGSGRTDRRSRAAAASAGFGRRRRPPRRSCSALCRSRPPGGGLGSHTRRTSGARRTRQRMRRQSRSGA